MARLGKLCVFVAQGATGLSFRLSSLRGAVSWLVDLWSLRSFAAGGAAGVLLLRGHVQAHSMHVSRYSTANKDIIPQA